ncbi:hypothetical protein NQ315_001264 [Exocentrus adspersus]|uniref:Core Histone H2A/H2B/H3 domain-containing protein n=1 Tax=Exocentrus adspersus TaxID=1586481 RepID=A0AAV8WFG4_9CUCU|nr:hypothetical protein NQ315_001264 [Exocentrus adspersus]
MVKRKATPRKSSSPKKRRRQPVHLYKIGNKDFHVYASTLRAIRKLQTSTKLCIPRLPFCRLIKEILMDVGGGNDRRIQVEALRALQEAAEMYLTQLFEDANKCAMHAKRVTLVPKDVRLVLDIKGCSDPGYTSM